MFPTQISNINPEFASRCEERSDVPDHRKSLSPLQKTDAAIKDHVGRALWNDDVLRAIEYHEIDVHVKNGVVYLSGHIVSTTSQSRITNALRAIPGILGIQNNLVLDDRLTNEVAASLGPLEHTYGCKFFTGAAHGVVSLNGTVSNEQVKLLAEQCVASHPDVRAVINNVRVSGAEPGLRDQPFLQPTIGGIVYFLDGISGVVKQVIINPDNRRVVAMLLGGQFTDQHQDIQSSHHGESRPPERLVVVPMDAVRYMTRVSGFLHTRIGENNGHTDFDPTRFSAPKQDWKAPYPYCPEDVLLPLTKREVEYQFLAQLPRSPFVVQWQERPLRGESLAADGQGR